MVPDALDVLLSVQRRAADLEARLGQWIAAAPEIVAAVRWRSAAGADFTRTAEAWHARLRDVSGHAAVVVDEAAWLRMRLVAS